MAAGNFNIAAEAEHVGDFKEIETALSTVLVDLSKTLREIGEVSELVASNASQIADGAQSLTPEQFRDVMDAVKKQAAFSGKELGGCAGSPYTQARITTYW